MSEQLVNGYIHVRLGPQLVAEAKGRAMSHWCHWPGCDQRVPPRLWGCRPHWLALPVEIRNKILGAYVKGQEIRKTPSARYIEAAREARQWVLMMRGERSRGDDTHCGALLSSEKAVYRRGRVCE